MAMLYEILIIWSCVMIGGHSLSLFETTVNNDTKIESKQFRKQYGDSMPKKGTFMPMQMKKKKDAPETFYEPYMEKGDWVFYRNQSTKNPTPYFLNAGNSTKHTECNQICSRMYQDVVPEVQGELCEACAESANEKFRFSQICGDL